MNKFLDNLVGSDIMYLDGERETGMKLTRLIFAALLLAAAGWLGAKGYRPLVQFATLEGPVTGMMETI